MLPYELLGSEGERHALLGAGALETSGVGSAGRRSGPEGTLGFANVGGGPLGVVGFFTASGTRSGAEGTCTIVQRARSDQVHDMA